MRRESVGRMLKINKKKEVEGGREGGINGWMKERSDK
jgi:hypothetical protein